MKKRLLTLTLTALFFFTFSGIGTAMEGHGGKDDAIRHTMSDGFHLTYKLIDMRAKMEAMGHDHSKQKMPTHHLMLYIKSDKSEPVKNAKVGFLVKNADGKKETVMTMAMGEGYGGDITLDKPGDYTIKVKAVTGDKKLVDTFTYNLK